MSKFTENLQIADKFQIDTIAAADGTPIDFIFFKHASLAISTPQYTIYIDPIMSYAPYASLPKADIIAITHAHYDHLDVEAIDAVKGVDMPIICPKSVADVLGREVLMMSDGSEVKPIDGLKVEGVSAYNYTKDHLQFHPKEREDCGFVFTIAGTRIYIAGDTEDTPELKALKGVDVAFLPVNQPYTMSVDQAVSAIQALRPKIFYPYHFGGGDKQTNLNELVEQIGEICEVRVRDME